MQVVEAVAAVIDWHVRDLLPDTVGLAADVRCELVHADFFAMMAAGTTPQPTYDAVLLDIDHSPKHLLDPSHAAFYDVEGLRGLAQKIKPGGVFGLWSDDAPDPTFEAALTAVFAVSTTHVVTFANPITGGESESTVYVAQV